MKRIRPISRRSFLERVVGGVVAGGTMTIVGGRAHAQERQMVVDADPSDPARPPATDQDEGATADPANLGRGGAEARREGVSDADGGPAKDPLGSGRGQRTRVGAARATARPRNQAGRTDSDSGPNADAVGQGRSGGFGTPSGGGAGGTSRFVSCPGHPRCPRSGG